MKLKQIFLIILYTATLASCDWLGGKSNDGNAVLNDMIIANSDYSTGSLSVLDPNMLTTSNDILKGEVDSDIKVRSFNNLIYVLNNVNDNIQLVNPDGFSTVKQQSTGSDSYPHDIIVTGTKAYVSLNGYPKLWIINPLTLEKTGEIDLSAYTPAGASSPSLSQMWLDGNNGYLYIAAQRIVYDSSFMATIDYSSVIVINTATDQIVSEIKLQWTSASATVNAVNPISKFVEVDNSSWGSDGHRHIFILCAGLRNSDWTDKKDGGIIAIDITDRTCETGFITTEASLGKAMSDFECVNGIIYAYTNDGFGSSSHIFKINPVAGITETIIDFSSNDGTSFIKSDSSGNLYISDRSTSNPGIWVYDTSAGTMKTDSVISTALPPYDITILK